jgi:hypothetical protein
MAALRNVTKLLVGSHAHSVCFAPTLQGTCDPTDTNLRGHATLRRERSTKTLAILALVLFVTGCPTVSAMQGNASSPIASASPAQQSITPFSSWGTFSAQQPSSGPRFVTPATGGTPVWGTPIGGNLYLPATGGPPIVGMP